MYEHRSGGEHHRLIPIFGAQFSCNLIGFKLASAYSYAMSGYSWEECQMMRGMMECFCVSWLFTNRGSSKAFFAEKKDESLECSRQQAHKNHNGFMLYVHVFSPFFRCWLKKNFMGNLAAVATIPDTDNGKTIRRRSEKLSLNYFELYRKADKIFATKIACDIIFKIFPRPKR